MHQHTVEVNVACSVEEVYNLWQRVENVPRWMPLVKEVKIIKGSDDLSLWKFGLGFPLLTQWTSHITQRVPQKLIAWESVSGLKNRGCAEFFPTDKGCRLCLTVAFDLPGGVVGTLLKTVNIDCWLEANLVESLNRFQSLIEKEVLRQKGW